jgi:hypothetical protein
MLVRILQRRLIEHRREAIHREIQEAYSEYRRQGWDAQFAGVAQNQDDQLMDGAIPTAWDEDEWTWQQGVHGRSDQF